MMRLDLQEVYLMWLYGDKSSPYSIEMIPETALKDGLIIEGAWPGCSWNNYRLKANLQPWDSSKIPSENGDGKQGIFIYGTIPNIHEKVLKQLNAGLIYPIRVCEPVSEILSSEFDSSYLKPAIKAVTNACRKLNAIEKSLGQECTA